MQFMTLVKKKLEPRKVDGESQQNLHKQKSGHKHLKPLNGIDLGLWGVKAKCALHNKTKKNNNEWYAVAIMINSATELRQMCWT